MPPKKNVIAVRVTDEQHEFLLQWQRHLQEEMGMEIPLGALVRRMLDRTIQDFHAHGDSGVPPGTEEHKRAVRGFMEKYHRKRKK